MPIHQYTNYFGTQIPWYGICVGCSLLMIGFLMLLDFRRFKMNGDQQNEILFGFPFMILCGLIVAFGLDAIFTGDWRTWSNPVVRKIGFTFTGWLLGAFMFLICYGRRTSLGAMFFLNMFLPIFALSQSIGDVPTYMRWSLAVIFGSGAAGVVQVGTTLTRAFSTVTTGGSANNVVTTGENVGAVSVTLLGVILPIVGLIVAAVLGGVLAWFCCCRSRDRRKVHSLAFCLAL